MSLIYFASAYCVVNVIIVLFLTGLIAFGQLHGISSRLKRVLVFIAMINVLSLSLGVQPLVSGTLDATLLVTVVQTTELAILFSVVLYFPKKQEN